MEEKVLMQWKEMDRPNKEWSKDFYSTVIVLAFLISVILFLIDGFMPVFAVWAVVFVMWAINKTPAQETTYAITESGLREGQSTIRYQEIRNYWIEERWGNQLLRVATFRPPWQSVFVIQKGDEQKIRQILDNYVVYDVPKPGWGDRVLKWLGDKIPLE